MSSIRSRLLSLVLLALCAGSIVLMAGFYLFTLDEMNEVFDENLKQVALAVDSHHPFEPGMVPPARPRLPSQPEFFEEEGEDFNFVTLTWSRDGKLLFSSDPDKHLPFIDHNGLSQVKADGEDWNVYTIEREGGVVQAAQKVSSRQMLAAETVSGMLLPVVLFVMAVALVMLVALKHGLSFVDMTAQRVATRSASSLERIEEADLPRELRPLVGSINDLMQRLESALQSQRRFVADAAHELRTPVTALRLQLQLLERSPDDQVREAALAELRQGIARAQRLIAQLLQLSRVEPEAPGPSRARIDVAALARDVVSEMSVLAEARQIDLGVDAPPSVTVCADAHPLRVLLINLVENALRYCPEGSVVDVRVEPQAGGVLLRVIDNGPGIAPGERARVFDRFYRGEGVQADPQQTGSGLGLSIVRAIAERHQATVSLHEGSGGRGLEVRVVLPADRAHGTMRLSPDSTGV